MGLFDEPIMPTRLPGTTGRKEKSEDYHDDGGPDRRPPTIFDASQVARAGR